MKKSRTALQLNLAPIDNRRLADLCGQLDEHLRQIERYFGVEINNRAHAFEIIGLESSVEKTRQLLETLYKETEEPNQIDPQRVHLLLQSIQHQNGQKKFPENYGELVVHAKQLKVQPRSANQHYYVKNILEYDINFGIGPSGTGKTYLAVACAVAALEKGQVQRIILVRPVVEAGERLGFLPGDVAEKIDPYLRPLYDALYQMLGVEQVGRLMERGVIELAPLAYMRGRTLSEAFVILDEGQNTTKEQMKMFLTRIGFGSKVVITGDITQIDLPKAENSGLRDAIMVLKDLKEVPFTFFQSNDVVRHPLVQLIVEAYDKIER